MGENSTQWGLKKSVWLMKDEKNYSFSFYLVKWDESKE